MTSRPGRRTAARRSPQEVRGEAAPSALPGVLRRLRHDQAGRRRDAQAHRRPGEGRQGAEGSDRRRSAEAPGRAGREIEGSAGRDGRVEPRGAEKRRRPGGRPGEGAERPGADPRDAGSVAAPPRPDRPGQRGAGPEARRDFPVRRHPPEGAGAPDRQGRPVRGGAQEARRGRNRRRAPVPHRVPRQVRQGRAGRQRAILAGRDVLCGEALERRHRRVPEGLEGPPREREDARRAPQDRHGVPEPEGLQERDALLRRGPAGLQVRARGEDGPRAGSAVQEPQAQGGGQAVALSELAQGIVTTVRSRSGTHWQASRFPPLNCRRCRNFSFQVGGLTAAGSRPRRKMAQAVPGQRPLPLQGWMAAKPRCRTMPACEAAWWTVDPCGTSTVTDSISNVILGTGLSVYRRKRFPCNNLSSTFSRSPTRSRRANLPWARSWKASAASTRYWVTKWLVFSSSSSGSSSRWAPLRQKRSIRS